MSAGESRYCRNRSLVQLLIPIGTTMKYTLLVVMFALVLVGCSESPRPLDSGTPISGTVWAHPTGAVGSNTGTAIPNEARVDVFETVIIIRHADGSRQIVPLTYVSDLTLK